MNSNPSCGVEEDGLQHRAMVLACALAEAEDVGKMVVKKVKARGNGMGWDGRAADREESTATAHSVAAKSFTALFMSLYQ